MGKTMTTVAPSAQHMNPLQNQRAVCTIQNVTPSSIVVRLDIATQKLAVNRIEAVVSMKPAIEVVASICEAARWIPNAALDLSAIGVIAN